MSTKLRLDKAPKPPFTGPIAYFLFSLNILSSSCSLLLLGGNGVTCPSSFCHLPFLGALLSHPETRAPLLRFWTWGWREQAAKHPGCLPWDDLGVGGRSWAISALETEREPPRTLHLLPKRCLRSTGSGWVRVPTGSGSFDTKAARSKAMRWRCPHLLASGRTASLFGCPSGTE